MRGLKNGLSASYLEELVKAFTIPVVR